MSTAFTSKDIDFIKHSVDLLRASGGRMFSAPCNIAIEDNVETDDLLLIDNYAICRYMSDVTRKSIAGNYTTRELCFEVSVEVHSPGTYWDPPDVDYSVLGVCASLADAVLMIAHNELTEHMRQAWRCEAEAEADVLANEGV